MNVKKKKVFVYLQGSFLLNTSCTRISGITVVYTPMAMIHLLSKLFFERLSRQKHSSVRVLYQYDEEYSAK